ncbi:MAG: T9SS type A sorting domain-containing protein [Phycisphaerae bacterium]|nr:T9SS type A sorting domain-containing protein [Saprospiraceae bacterium]
MKKCFLAFCLLCFMSHTGFANVIIDLDIKLSKEVPASYVSLCGPAGCNFVWTPGQAQWMAIQGPLFTYTPFSFVMKNIGAEGKVSLQEGNSSHPIPGAGIALPDGECEEYHSTNEGYVRLRICDGNGEEALAILSITRQGNILTLRILPNSGGFILSKLELGSPPPPPADGESLPKDRSASTITGSNAESISPNPFSQSLEVKTSASGTESVRLQLLNANGQSLRAQTYKGGLEAYTLPTEGVPTGFYFLWVQVADRVQVYRVIKID